MTTTPAPTHITLDEFTEILSRYPATMSDLSKTNTAPKLIKPDESSELSSEELDVWRLDTLPVAVKARDKPCIEKEELQKLLGCKMARGKRRQALPKLIATNDPSTVTTVTATAFDHLLAAPSPPTTSLILATLKELTDPLKGVGPATASYILAVVAPDTVPVFSDEAYRWITYSTSREGWGKKIKYDAKEYRTYVDGVKALVERLGEGVTAGDVEKVGFVLGKEGAGFRSIPSIQAQSGLDALDAALGLETEQSAPAPPVPTAPAVPAARPKVARKRRADENPNEDAEEPSEPKPAQKRKASEPKRGGVKMGRVFVRTR